MLFIEKFGVYTTEGKEGSKGKASAKKQDEREGILRGLRGVEGRHRNENLLARPKKLREKAKIAIRVGDLDLPERRGVPVVEERRKMHRCALVAKQLE